MHIVGKIAMISALTLFAACDRSEQRAINEDLNQVGQDIEEGVGQVGDEIGQGAEQVGDGAQQLGQDAERGVNDWDWNAWDENQDASIQSEEFGRRSGEMYGGWAGDDRQLNQDELARGMFESLDQNDSGALEQDEFDARLVSAMGGERFGSYAEWDINDSGQVEQNEFLRVFEQTGVYERWDRNRDQNVEQEEFQQGWFEDFDRNRSGTLERDEWGFEGGGV